jgi:ribonuclease D
MVFPFLEFVSLFYIPAVIDTDQKLNGFLPRLRSADWIALDTEADSLHAYPEKLCLVQISLPGEDELLDPLSEANLKPVFDLLSTRELILHGADYDLRLLRKSCGFVPAAIFDTMLASRLLGCREFGLNSLVSKYLKVTLEKGPQKANWAQRPLTQRMAEYARNDTRYLKPLADILQKQLREKGRLAWHRETCDCLIKDCAQIRPSDPDVVWRVKGSHRLAPAALGVLRAIWHWRETEAVGANKPPYFVLPPETMVDLADAAVESRSLKEILPRHISPRRRQGILEAIEKGLAAEKLPTVLRSQPYRQSETEKRRMQELEKIRDRRAAELDIDPTLIASRAMLVLLAKDRAKHEQQLMKWQRDLLTP